MASKHKPHRARSVRRTEERLAAKLSKAQQRLFELEPGGSPERPIEIQSAALVEPKAASFKCPSCAVTLRVEEHRAQTVAGKRLREAVVLCPRCGKRRSLWFRLMDELN